MKKISKNLKKIVAIVCSIALLVGTVFVDIPAKKAQAADTTGTEATAIETMPSDMKEITFTDLGITDGEYGSVQKTYSYSGATLDNTVLSGKFTFKPAMNAAGTGYDNTILYWGNILIRTNSTTGLRVQFSGDQAWTYLNDANLINQPINMKLSIQYVNHDDVGTKDDVKFGIWIDDCLYNNEYIYYDNVRETVETNKKIVIGASARIDLASVETSVRSLPEDLTKITFTNLGIADGTYTSSKSFSVQYQESLIGKVLCGKVNLTKGTSGDVTLYIGGKTATTGLMLRTGGAAGTPLRVYSDDKNSDGVQAWKTPASFFDSCANREVALMMSFEAADYDGDLQVDDLKLGMWFDGELYNNDYIYLIDYVPQMGQYLASGVTGDSTAKLQSVNVGPTEKMPSDMKEITFKDLGMADDEYGSAQKTYSYSGATLDNTVLSGKFTFKPAMNAAGTGYDNTILYWGNILIRTNSTTGLRVQFSGDSTWTYLNDANLINQPINMKLSIQYVNHDGGTAKDDVKLGIWIDGQLYNNEYIHFDNKRDMVEANKKLTIGTAGTTRMQLESVTAKKRNLPEELDKITFKDLGVADGTYTSSKSFSVQYAESLIGKVLCGKVNLAKGASGDVTLYIGGKTATTGLMLRTGGAAGTPLRVYSDDKNSDGVQAWKTPASFFDSCANREVALMMSFEAADYDGDLQDDDLKLGMWFDGELYNNDYIYLIDYVPEMGTYIASGITGDSTAKLESVELPARSFPSDLKEITFDDFAEFEVGSYTGGVSTFGQYAEDLDGTVFVGKVKFTRAEGGEPCIIIGGKNSGHGLVLRTSVKDDVECLRLYSDPRPENAITERYFYSDVAGTELIGKEFRLYLTFQCIDSDGNGEKNDLKLGIWFNGVLYDNQYIYLKDYADTDYALGNYLYACGLGSGTLELQSTVKTVEEYTLEDDWANTTKDFPSTEATAYDIYYWGETQGYIYSKEAVESESGSEYYMTYTVDAFSGTNNKYGLVGTSSPEEAYPFVPGKGLIYSANFNGDENPLFQVGYTYLVTYKVTDHAYEYKVLRVKGDSKQVLVSQKKIVPENETTYAHFGIYLEGEAVNAKLSNVRFWSKDGVDLQVASNSSQAVIFDAGYKKETNESYNLKNGTYVITGTDPIVVTSEDVELTGEYKAGDVLDTPGTYKIVSSYGLYTKNVELYEGDKKSTEISTEKHVMPIAGFYGPYRETDKNGTVRDHITEDAFQKIEDMGLNLIVASPGAWSKYDSSDAITKSLLLAEKHGIGLYLTDHSLLKQSDIASRFDFYSNFSSFKGLHLIDEPTTQSYYGGDHAANTLQFYTNMAKQLNQYTNLNGYINLFGMNKAWALEAGKDYKEYYKTYIDEYIADMDGSLPHHLSSGTYVYVEDAYGAYFDNLAALREKALEYKIPFWTTVQAGGNFNDAGVDLEQTNNNTPTKGEFLWNVNTALAYGAQGIQYFPLVQSSKFAYEDSEDQYDYERNGLIGANGELTEWGKHVKTANEQVAAIDEVLMDATSEDVLAIGDRLTTYIGINKTSSGKLQSVTAEKGALVGVFSYRGKEAFYVVNDDVENAQNITLTFDGEYNYRKMDRTATSYGKATTLTLENVPAGEAVLIVLDETIKGLAIDLSNYTDGIYTLPSEGVLSMWNTEGEFTEQTMVNSPGNYHYSYASSDESRCGKLLVYREGDVNVDNITDVRDLVRLKRVIDTDHEVVWDSAIKNQAGEDLRKLLVR